MAYKQVELLRDVLTSQIAWIPEEFAKTGTILFLNDDSKSWVVSRVFSMRIEDPIYPEALIRAHRRNTGDSTPRVK